MIIEDVDPKDYEYIIKKLYLKRIAIVTTISILFSVTIPNMKEIAFIYIVGKTTQNEQIQDMPDKALEILTIELNEYLMDLRKTSRRSGVN